MKCRANTGASGPLLRVRDLSVGFPTAEGLDTVVRDVGFDLHPGQVTALVGESGSGKSITARSVLRLVDAPGRVLSGSIEFDGQDVLRLNKSGLQRLRGDQIGMVFQEPMHSLNPVFTIGKQIIETLREHKNVSKHEAAQQAESWLERVGLPDPGRVMTSYPHELSGGMLQRAMIAMALSCGPRLLIADEPTTALDVTIQAQILDLLLDLRDETGMAILFITHDLGVVAQVADRVLVMYGGQILERADVYSLFEHPVHPYTSALLATKPVRGQRLRRLPTITDDVRLAAADPLPDALLASDQADTVGQPPRIDREEAS
jgi:ABC-type dipeptide/oligopeptide/nickel transport system ATPase component